MNTLSQIKKTSQEPYTIYKFNPATFTCSLVEVEPPTTFKPLRKPEIGEHEQRHIRKIKREGRKLDTETLQTLIQSYINSVLNSPVDDHPPPGPNAPKPWTEKGIEHKEDTQGQEAKPGTMSIDDAEARKNRAREERYRVMQQRPVKTRTEPLEAPKKQEVAKKKAKAKVIAFPKHHLTPKNILKYLKTMGVKQTSLVIFKAVHKASWWSNSSKLWIWHSKRHKWGRWCTVGIEGLVNITGLCEKCIRKGLKELEDNDVIFKRAHGRKGVSNTIWELALDMRHVNAEKRNPKRSKK